MFHWLGLITVFLNVALLLAVCFALVKLRSNYDLQFLMVVLATVLLLPAMIYENVLFLDLFFFEWNLVYSLSLLKITFALGILGVAVFNLIFLTLEDMPTFPLIILFGIVGFAIGGMTLALQLDSSNPVIPLRYDPIQGGLFFTFSLAIFNLLGLVALLYAVASLEGTKVTKKVDPITMFGVAVFFVAPYFVIIQRIFLLILNPFNFLFLFYELGLFLVLGNFLWKGAEAGVPTFMDLKALILIDNDTKDVIAMYSAVSSDLSKIFNEESETNSLKFVLGEVLGNQIAEVYTTAAEGVMVPVEDFILLIVVSSRGKKVTKWLANEFLKSIRYRPIESEDDFRQRLLHYFMMFFRNKTPPSLNQFKIKNQVHFDK